MNVITAFQWKNHSRQARTMPISLSCLIPGQDLHMKLIILRIRVGSHHNCKVVLMALHFLQGRFQISWSERIYGGKHKPLHRAALYFRLSS